MAKLIARLFSIPSESDDDHHHDPNTFDHDGRRLANGSGDESSRSIGLRQGRQPRSDRVATDGNVGRWRRARSRGSSSSSNRRLGGGRKHRSLSTFGRRSSESERHKSVINNEFEAIGETINKQISAHAKKVDASLGVVLHPHYSMETPPTSPDSASEKGRQDGVRDLPRPRPPMRAAAMDPASPPVRLDDPIFSIFIADDDEEGTEMSMLTLPKELREEDARSQEWTLNKMRMQAHNDTDDLVESLKERQRIRGVRGESEGGKYEKGTEMQDIKAEKGNGIAAAEDYAFGRKKEEEIQAAPTDRTGESSFLYKQVGAHAGKLLGGMEPRCSSADEDTIARTSYDVVDGDVDIGDLAEEDTMHVPSFTPLDCHSSPFTAKMHSWPYGRTVPPRAAGPDTDHRPRNLPQHFQQRQDHHQDVHHLHPQREEKLHRPDCTPTPTSCAGGGRFVQGKHAWPCDPTADGYSPQGAKPLRQHSAPAAPFAVATRYPSPLLDLPSATSNSHPCPTPPLSTTQPESTIHHQRCNDLSGTNRSGGLQRHHHQHHPHQHPQQWQPQPYMDRFVALAHSDTYTPPPSSVDEPEGVLLTAPSLLHDTTPAHAARDEREEDFGDPGNLKEKVVHADPPSSIPFDEMTAATTKKEQVSEMTEGSVSGAGSWDAEKENELATDGIHSRQASEDWFHSPAGKVDTCARAVTPRQTNCATNVNALPPGSVAHEDANETDHCLSSITADEGDGSRIGVTQGGYIDDAGPTEEHGTTLHPTTSLEDSAIYSNAHQLHRSSWRSHHGKLAYNPPQFLLESPTKITRPKAITDDVRSASDDTIFDYLLSNKEYTARQQRDPLPYSHSPAILPEWLIPVTKLLPVSMPMPLLPHRIVQIQAWVRCALEQQRFLALQNSVILIQRHMRRFVYRKKYLLDLKLRSSYFSKRWSKKTHIHQRCRPGSMAEISLKKGCHQVAPEDHPWR